MTVLDRVPVEAITQRAQRADPVDVGRLILAFVGGVLYALTFGLARLVRSIMKAARWVVAAIAVGWSDGWKRPEPEPADG